jgi:hypothetical protein
MKNIEKNKKQKIYLLKGGSGDWLKENGATQGPYGSLLNLFTFFGNIFGNTFRGFGKIFSSWGTWFALTYLYFYTFVYRKALDVYLSAASTAASLGGQIFASVTSSVLDVINKNSVQVTEITTTITKAISKK